MNTGMGVRLGPVLLMSIVGMILACTALGDEMEAYFDMDIQVQKDLYQLGEPIWVDVQLSYTGQDTLVLPYRPLCLGCGTFDVQVRSRDRVFLYTGPVGLWVPTPQKVAPEEVISKSFDIVSEFGEPVEGTRLMEKTLPVGANSVSVHEFGVSSQTVSFNIEEPSGYDAVIYQAILEANVLTVRHLRLDAATSLETLLPTVGNSPYRDKLLFEIALVWLPNRIEHLNACRRIVDYDPNSPYARYATLRLLQTMTQVEAEALREDIDGRAPGSRAANAAAEALSKGWIGISLTRPDD